MLSFYVFLTLKYTLSIHMSSILLSKLILSLTYKTCVIVCIYECPQVYEMYVCMFAPFNQILSPSLYMKILTLKNTHLS